MAERIFLGTVESADRIIIPAPVLSRANAALDEARRKREHEAEIAKLATLQAARSQGRLRKALTALGFRRRRR
jgi:hypothetical protein